MPGVWPGWGRGGSWQWHLDVVGLQTIWPWAGPGLSLSPGAPGASEGHRLLQGASYLHFRKMSQQLCDSGFIAWLICSSPQSHFLLFYRILLVRA